MDQVEEIKRKVDIVGLIAEHVELKRAGRNFKGLCPFHSEKTPSFMVSPEIQIFKCFGCGTGGDAYRFLMEFEKIEFPEALKILAQRAGVKLEPLRGFPEYQEKEEIYRVNHLLGELYHYILISHGLGKTAREYLGRRGITQEAIKTFQIGFAPDSSDFAFRFLTAKKGYSPALLERAGIAIKKEGRFFDRFRARLMFPLRDHLGNTLGFSARVLEARGDLAKYINTPDTQVYKKGRVLYGLDIIKPDIKKQGFAVLVEGEFDAISSWQAGVKNIVAIKGSALTSDQARLLSRFCQTLHFALDSDPAGDEAARRGVEIAQKEGLEVKVVVMGGFKDPDDAAQKDPAGWQKAVENAVGVYDFWLESVFRRFDPKTAEGKGKISRNLVPVLAKIEDEIVRAHYIKQTAQRLGVPEDAVASQVAKQKEPAGWQRKEESAKGPPLAKTRRDVLEGYLLSLVFQTTPKTASQIKPLIKTPTARRVLDEFEAWMAGKKKFSASGFASSLPAELVDFFASLLLLDTEKLVLEDRVGPEIEKTEKALKAMLVRERIEDLTRKIKELEEKGQVRDIKNLETELAKAGGELTLIEQEL